MALSADVLIVARQDDRVAARLRRALDERSYRAVQLDGPAAARLFTLRVLPDRTLVVPSLPMFIRPSAWWSDAAPETADARFHRAEEYAAFWAAAALSGAPVINRPTRHGGVGRLTFGAIAGAIDVPVAPGRAEILASGPEMVADADAATWAEDANYNSAPIDSLPPRAPVRARKIDPAALYEIVTVVGARGFPATADPRTAALGLVGKSLALAARVGVHFAAVTWSIDDAGATPVRMSDAPDETELRYAWNEIAIALVEDLTQ